MPNPKAVAGRGFHHLTPWGAQDSHSVYVKQGQGPTDMPAGPASLLSQLM